MGKERPPPAVQRLSAARRSAPHTLAPPLYLTRHLLRGALHGRDSHEKNDNDVQHDANHAISIIKLAPREYPASSENDRQPHPRQRQRRRPARPSAHTF